MNYEIIDKFKELEACDACDDEYIDLINQFPQHRYTRFDNIGDDGKHYELFLEWIDNESVDTHIIWQFTPGYGSYSHVGNMPEQISNTADTKINEDTLEKFVSWNDLEKTVTKLGEAASKIGINTSDLYVSNSWSSWEPNYGGGGGYG